MLRFSRKIFMEKYDFVVLGAGLAGLSFAKRMSENGKSVLVLEKESQVGGLSRSIYHNGFYLDFCAHRFHTKNEAILNELLALEGLKMSQHVKKSRIYMFGKYLKYPFELQNLLRAMPVHKSFLSGMSFLSNAIAKKIKTQPELKSYKDWFIYFYGSQLYNVMCYPYASKIWHTDPANLSADWADQRFQGENMSKLIKRIITKFLTLDFSSYSIEDESLAPDGGIFYYPNKGIQELSDALANASVKKGAKIICSADLTGVSTKNKTVSYISNDRNYTVDYENLISTISLDQYYKLQDKKDFEIETVLSKTKYMDIIFVYLFLNKERVSNDHWLYFPDKDIIFNRAVEFSNWSPEMCPKGKTSICFDITDYAGSEIWNMSDKDLTERTIADAERIKYIERKDVFGSYVYRLRYAYPFYDLDYKERLDKLVKFFESENVYLLGRAGIFKYNNADNSIEMAFALADNFIQKKPNKSIYEYKIKEVSL